MTTYIIYDSNYGSTRMIAEKIARSLPVEATVLNVRDVDPQALATVDFVIIGSTTIGGQPTEAIKTFLHRIPAPVHPGAQAAAFDTRLNWKILSRFSFAASHIADSLRQQGWPVALEPIGFFSKGARSGTVQSGELERAADWARKLAREMGN